MINYVIPAEKAVEITKMAVDAGIPFTVRTRVVIRVNVEDKEAVGHIMHTCNIIQRPRI